MAGHLFIVRGDITRLAADAIAYSADRSLEPTGEMHAAFASHLPGFEQAHARLKRRNRGARLSAGTSFWLPLDSTRPRGVVVAVSTGGSRRGEAAVESALLRGTAELRRSGVPGRLLIALPAFLMGAGADRSERLAAALAQLRATRQVLERTEALDAAFVAFTEGVYQIYLEARRRLEPARESAEDPVAPAELSQALEAGECVLFVGSGVSLGSGLPSWGGLIGELERDLGLPPTPAPDLERLLDVAEWSAYARPGGRRRLARRVHQAFSSEATGARPSLAHYLLASLPSSVIVTTNYDDLLERALEGQRQLPVPVVRGRDLARVGDEAGRYVVKLHGDAQAAGRGAESLVLTREDYETYFQRRPAMAAFLEGLLLQRTFFFVGYGLRDLDFRLLFARIAEMLEGARCKAFATSFDASPFAARQWARRGLHLLTMPGRDIEEQASAQLRFLDRLTARVTGAPQLFLAEGVDVKPGLKVRAVRGKLLEVGAAVERACHAQLTPGEARRMAAALDFLANQGWRPTHATPLGTLYRRLALQVEPALRRQLLVQALAHARTQAEASEIESALGLES